MMVILGGRGGDDVVVIADDVVERLKTYHLMGVRFLYECFARPNKGAILNEDEGMNFQIQISVFLKAIYKGKSAQFPILIICPGSSIGKWHYHICNDADLSVILLSESNHEHLVHDGKSNVILASFDHLNLLKNYKNYEFSYVIIESLDEVVTKVNIRSLRGNFNIGLTTRNFIKNRDPNLQFHMLNWSNPGVFGKKAKFLIDEEEHFREYREAYEDYWLRITWKFCDSFKRSSFEEQNYYGNLIFQWSKQQKLPIYSGSPLKLTKSQTSRKLCKRKSDVDKIGNNLVKHRNILTESEGELNLQEIDAENKESEDEKRQKINEDEELPEIETYEPSDKIKVDTFDEFSILNAIMDKSDSIIGQSNSDYSNEKSDNDTSYCKNKSVADNSVKRNLLSQLYGSDDEF